MSGQDDQVDPELLGQCIDFVGALAIDHLPLDVDVAAHDLFGQCVHPSAGLLLQSLIEVLQVLEWGIRNGLDDVEKDDTAVRAREELASDSDGSLVLFGQVDGEKDSIEHEAMMTAEG